ncbi:MAG: hypothetical protein ABFQ53_01325 [Patescibacteria group bacterium]
MIAHLRSLFFSIVFLGVIEYVISIPFSFSDTKSLTLAGLLCVFAVFAGWSVGKKFIFVFLPLSLTISSLGLLFFIDSLKEQQIFGFLVFLLFYISLLGIKRISTNPFDMTARSLFSATLIANIFFFYALIYGVYINFNIPLYLFIGVNFLFVLIVTVVSLRAYCSNYKRIFLYSIIIAFSMIQLVWMANFWPFGYLTMAAITLMFYYVLWDLVQMVFLETLSKKRIVITIIFCVVLTLLVLLTTQWILVG